MSYIDGVPAEDWIEESRPKNGWYRVYWSLPKKLTFHDIIKGKRVSENLTTGLTDDGSVVGKGSKKSYLEQGYKLKYEWKYKNGKRADGESKGWWPNGQIKQIQTWKDGVPHGPHTAWYDNGNLFAQRYYKNRLEVGLWTYWYETGRKMREGNKKDNFESGIELHAKVTVFAEGCRGHLGKQLINKFNLNEEKDPQQYGIGFKEIWEIDEKKHEEGLVMHTAGWPLDNNTYGGSFMYHAENKQIFLGYVIGLDYKNPHLSPFEEFQKFKTHPQIKKIIEGGKRISYGARALIEGGIQSLPKMFMPGALLVGCDAGTLNTPKIKGSHTAMKSGIVAAETIVEHIKEKKQLSIYEEKFKNSWAYKELYLARNVKPSFNWGLIIGILFTGIDQILFRGKLPFTLKHKHADHETLLPANETKKIEYLKPDGVITFDKTSSVYLTGTNHTDNQPVHLQLKDSNLPINYTLEKFDEPAQRYCPAGVYEVQLEGGISNFVINSQNCIHCKTCDIKEPSQNINWITPEGGGGPKYGNM